MKAVITLILLLASQDPSGGALPSKIIERLDKEFPGWQWGNVASKIKQFHKHEYGEDYPPFIVGDFNGDQKSDYAMKLTIDSNDGKKDVAIAFVSKDSSYSYHLLSELSSDYERYMVLHRNGEEYYDYEPDTYSTFLNDAIGLYYFEKAGGAFIFKDGKFVGVHTSD